MEHGARPGMAFQILDGTATAAGPCVMLMKQAKFSTAVALWPALVSNCACFRDKQYCHLYYARYIVFKH